MKKLAVILSGVLMGALGFANASLSSAINYQDLQHALESLADPSHTLVVLDDDNTLTTMPCPDQNNIQTCQYIGGTAWGMWQTSLPLDSPERIGTNSMVYAASNLFFALSNEVYTEPDVPVILSELGAEGASIIVETARAEDAASATEDQFNQLQISQGVSLLSFLRSHGLKTLNGQSSLAGSFLPCQKKTARLVRYEDGVFYVDGQNKGQMLQCLFPALDLAGIKNIIFMDDTPQNDVDVSNAYKDQSTYQVIALVYHGMDAHRDAFLKGSKASEYQAQATKVWKMLSAVIEAGIAKPSLNLAS